MEMGACLQKWTIKTIDYHRIQQGDYLLMASMDESSWLDRVSFPTERSKPDPGHRNIKDSCVCRNDRNLLKCTFHVPHREEWWWSSKEITYQKIFSLRYIYRKYLQLSVRWKLSFWLYNRTVSHWLFIYIIYKSIHLLIQADQYPAYINRDLS